MPLFLTPPPSPPSSYRANAAVDAGYDLHDDTLDDLLAGGLDLAADGDSDLIFTGGDLYGENAAVGSKKTSKRAAIPLQPSNASTYSGSVVGAGGDNFGDAVDDFDIRAPLGSASAKKSSRFSGSGYFSGDSGDIENLRRERYVVTWFFCSATPLRVY